MHCWRVKLLLVYSLVRCLTVIGMGWFFTIIYCYWLMNGGVWFLFLAMGFAVLLNTCFFLCLGFLHVDELMIVKV